MRKKNIAVLAAALALGITALPAQVSYAGEEKQVTSDSKGQEEGKEKMEAAVKKWNSLSKEQKNEVYKIIEEKHTVDGKLLDKYVSLGIMDAEDAKQIKADMKQRLSELKESGRLPLGGKRPPKCGCKQQQNNQKQE